MKRQKKRVIPSFRLRVGIMCLILRRKASGPPLYVPTAVAALLPVLNIIPQRRRFVKGFLKSFSDFYMSFPTVKKCHDGITKFYCKKRGEVCGLFTENLFSFEKRKKVSKKAKTKKNRVFSKKMKKALDKRCGMWYNIKVKAKQSLPLTCMPAVLRVEIPSLNVSALCVWGRFMLSHIFIFCR